MHVNKKVLTWLLLGMTSSTLVVANIPIESKSLSPSAVSSAENSNLNWNLLQKNEQLENQLRVLRGQIEELQNTVEKMTHDMSNRYTDLDQRIELLNEKVNPSADADTPNGDAPASEPAAETPSPAPANTAPISTPNPDGSAPNNPSLAPVNTAAPTAKLTASPATLSPAATVVPSASEPSAIPVNGSIGTAAGATKSDIVVASSAQNVRLMNATNAVIVTPTLPMVTTQSNISASPTPTLFNTQAETKRPMVTERPRNKAPTDQERSAYTVALEAYKNGGAKQAITPMQTFISNFPDSVYVGNAHFWLGEFNLANDPVNYEKAKENYGVVIRRYPNSAKAPRALFQLYNISRDVDRSELMAQKYKAQLIHYYPNSEEAKYLATQ